MRFPSRMRVFTHVKLIKLTTLCLLLASPSVEAHGGHGNEFAGQEGQKSTTVPIDRATAQRIGIQLTAAKKQSLSVEIAATGQIELLPSKKVEVTAPIKGKLVQLLVQPGSKVKAGQALAMMSSPELSDLKVTGLEKRSEAVASLQQAQTDLNLAQQSYRKIVVVAKAEVNQAQSQLLSAQSRLSREQQLVKSGSIVRAAKNTYQRQRQIANSEIQAAQTELQLAQERYQKDLELAKQGVLPRRQALESKSKLAAAQTQLVKAQGQTEVSQAATELRKAETDLPLRELRDAEKQVAELQGQLAKAQNQKVVVEAQAQVQKGMAAVTAAKNRLQLSDASYQGRLQQLGKQTDAQGLIAIKAPIDGTVTDREITIGQSVAESGSRLMTIADDRQVLATANIYERDVDKVYLGQRVNVKVATAGDRYFDGQITRVGNAIDGQSRVIPVQAALDNANGLLKAGMFAEINLATDQQTSPVIVIPASAVVDAQEEKLVYVQSGDGYQPITVTLGQTVGDLVEVKTGLFAGDAVVSQRAPQLYAQSLKSKPMGQHNAAPPVAANVSKIPAYLGWGLIPAGGLLLGGAVWFYRRRRLATSPAEMIEPEDTFEQANHQTNPTELLETDPPLLSASNPSGSRAAIDQPTATTKAGQK
jgi:membrane fusion protein, heavy metal efflux system